MSTVHAAFMIAGSADAVLPLILGYLRWMRGPDPWVADPLPGMRVVTIPNGPRPVDFLYWRDDPRIGTGEVTPITPARWYTSGTGPR